MFTILRTAMLCACATALLPLVPATAANLEAGEIVYKGSCANCHGASGQPDPSSPLVKSLGVVPANLADPLFNSREPAGDWEMVVKYGGDAMGLALQMPPHEQALSDEQIRDVVAYVKSLADTSAFPPGEMNLFLPVRTKKAFPEDEVVFKGRVTPENGEDSYKSVLEFEKRIGEAGQIVVELVHERDAVRNKLAKVEAGYKQALSWSDQHVLSAAAVIALPTDSEDGDGELQPYLAYGRILSDNWILQSSLRLKLPFDDSSDGSAELAGIVHYVHSPWPRRVFPGLEIVAEKPFHSSNGDLEWSALPQVRLGLTKGGHVALNVGVELPLSDQSWDERYHITVLWDFADGGVFKGW